VKLYVETSAATKLMIAEAESEALREFCNRPGQDLASTDLLDTELHRVAHRYGLGGSHPDRVLASITLHTLDRASFSHAGRLPQPHLRSLDALHVVGALRLAVDAILAYDDRFIEAAFAVGLSVLTPT